ncbi:MAG: flagellar biosynthetic protein FliO [Lachnospiraceae bacterium]|nr:flagellar biosynthetic protein FliO [Lachnospiraceae bacterium]
MMLTISEGADSYIQFMTLLVLFLIVLAVAWFVTKWMAGYQRGRVSNTNIEVLEMIGLSNNKYIQIIRVGQKYLAVAICKDTVTMLTEIPEQDLILSDGSVPKTMRFKDILDKVQNKSILEKEDGRDE